MLLFRWEYDPHLYGIPIDLTDTGHEYYYDDDEVTSDEEWMDSVGLGLTVMLDTGFRAYARRRRVDDFIELRAEGGWPSDGRFYLQEGDPGLASGLRSDGLDPSLALSLHASGRLLTWLVSYENNSTGHPYVGQAVVATAGPGEATLLRLETSPGVPASVRLDLAYFAAQAAVASGVQRVTTPLPDEFLDIAGFRTADDGRCLEAPFLDADPDGAESLMRASLDAGGGWGRDRDLGGRHLPTTRVGRLLHLVRRGPSGQSAKRRYRVG
ncbi:MAG TPA: hypothetical protein VMF51_17230 [Nocardioides sp.]|uniref:hypothetical protein n=1 Tax=Nocardioides sp. TaxID=35761 RepID=UPI002CED4883|nr:hypothetical protein [Nocardioides sp.]HTW16877.1 hypothetical protein [Nocardioides sp.]